MTNNNPSQHPHGDAIARLSEQFNASKLPVPDALPYKGKRICTDCFNALPKEENRGRGARMISWLSGSEIKHKCCKCGKDCYETGD